MAYLRHVLNGNTVTFYELADQILIGRHSECQIRIDDPTVSARHAKLEKIEQETEIWRLSDLNSTNGVRSGGNTIESLDLDQGVYFTIGAHEFEFLYQLPDKLDRTLKIKKSWIPGVYYTE